MADRYQERYRNEPYREDRDDRRDDRGFMERAGDEVRSWFGDEDAERRRRSDERERERERQRERAYGGDFGSGSEYGSRRDYGAGREYGAGGSRGWREERSPAERSWGGESWSSGDRWADDDDRSGYGRAGAASRPSRFETGYGTRYGGGYTGTPGTFGEGYRAPAIGSQSEGEARRRSGFSGRGPKGYQRSDARIHEDVCDRLTDAPDIDASDIEVRVSNGEVTLAGAVVDRTDKRRVEDLVEDISGVREVHNQLRVHRPQEGATAGAIAGAGTGTPGSSRR